MNGYIKDPKDKHKLIIDKSVVDIIKNIFDRYVNEKADYESQNLDNNEWVEKFKERKGITKLSRDIMMELIDCIYVKENGDIKIVFKFENEFKRYLDFIENNKNILDFDVKAV